MTKAPTLAATLTRERCSDRFAGFASNALWANVGQSGRRPTGFHRPTARFSVCVQTIEQRSLVTLKENETYTVLMPFFPRSDPVQLFVIVNGSTRLVGCLTG